MNKKCMLLVIITAVIIVSILLISGCGGTANTMMGETQTTGNSEDIDELLGLSDKDDGSKTDREGKDITEEDVLELLGVVDEKADDASKTDKISQSEEDQANYNRYNYKDERRSTNKESRTTGVEMDSRSFSQRRPGGRGRNRC